jgi:uncharacterized protein (TIGR03435 family)
LALRRTFVLISTCLIFAGVPLYAQANTAAEKDTGVKAPVYDVVSIKPSRPGGGVGQIMGLPDGFLIVNVSLSGVVYTAYHIKLDNQIKGLPGWTGSRYDIQAKESADTVEALKKLSSEEQDRQQQRMLQSVLADRCQLKVHWEMNEQPVYDLVIASGGLKMKAAANESPSSGYNDGHIVATADSVVSLADYLSRFVGRIVVDKTGLADKKYDFTLDWASDLQSEQADADAGPSIFTALQEQLGLKLIPAKGPVKILVIDHMERPSAN